MSGPKTSRYTLTPEQRRILAEQRKIERRKAVATANIKWNNKRLLHFGSLFSEERTIAQELNERTGSDGGFTERMEELEAVIAPIGSLIARTNNEDVMSLENTAKSLNDTLSKAERIASELKQISAENNLSLQNILQADIDKGFETSFSDVRPSSSGLNTIDKETLRTKLSTLKTLEHLPAEIIIKIDAALSKLQNIENDMFLSNFTAVTVTPLIKQCEQFLAEYEICHDEFERLYTEYNALCNLYYYVAQDYSCCADSIEKLKAEIKRITEETAEDDEQAYISECLDEVMEEMGYIVIGSREVTKKSGKHFRNELYQYSEGTAVNVTYSSDGRIAMELGGTDTTDRIPDAHETDTLCSSMERFCEDFKEIEKRLLARGVILADRISLLPPSAEYAQIINTSDYQMKEKTESVTEKKKRRNIKKNKTMRME